MRARHSHNPRKNRLSARSATSGTSCPPSNGQKSTNQPASRRSRSKLSVAENARSGSRRPWLMNARIPARSGSRGSQSLRAMRAPDNCTNAAIGRVLRSAISNASIAPCENPPRISGARGGSWHSSSSSALIATWACCSPSGSYSDKSRAEPPEIAAARPTPSEGHQPRPGNANGLRSASPSGNTKRPATPIERANGSKSSGAPAKPCKSTTSGPCSSVVTRRTLWCGEANKYSALKACTGGTARYTSGLARSKISGQSLAHSWWTGGRTSRERSSAEALSP